LTLQILSMKRLFLLAFLTCTIAGLRAQDRPQPVTYVLEKARLEAARTNRKVLLIFHASWCGWCKRLDASLNEPKLKPLFDRNFIIRHITVYESAPRKSLENPGAEEFLSEHGGADRGLPYFMIFDRNGKRLGDSQRRPGENVGCPAQDEEVDYFLSLLQRTTDLKPAELSRIGERFRKNRD